MLRVNSGAECTCFTLKKKYTYWIILVLVAVAIKIFSLFPAAIERYYSQGIYPYISKIQRYLFGWIPFSIGDVLYAVLILYLLSGIFYFFKRLFKRQLDKTYFLRIGKRLLAIFLWVYILFNGLWGLNYNRLGIGHQVRLHPKPYAKSELIEVLEKTIIKLHEIDSLNHDLTLHSKKDIFRKSYETYKHVSQEAAFLRYHPKSIKPSIFSYLGNYLGYSGYYNPITGEAQINTTVPYFLQPFTTTHEIGHQLGYAKEMEANFVGFLVARESQYEAVRYSIYFDLFMYAYTNLSRQDSADLKPLTDKLPQRVKNDVKTLRLFYKKYENPFEPVIRILYGKYLEANEQPKGILSYDEVLGWVIAYNRKFKRIRGVQELRS